MTYQVNLDLDETDRKQVKQLALDTGLTVRGLLTKIVQSAVRNPETKSNITETAITREK